MKSRPNDFGGLVALATSSSHPNRIVVRRVRKHNVIVVIIIITVNTHNVHFTMQVTIQRHVTKQ
jgi:hypothetical protein